MQKNISFILWLLPALLAFVLFAITAQYLSLRTDINFLIEKVELIDNPFWMSLFYIHVVSSMLVIFVAPLQFLKSLRKSNIKWHRLFGKLYVGSILRLAAPSGFLMAFYAEGGWWSTVGFSLLSMFWFFSTLKAFIAIKNRNVDLHEIWMIRSYAFTMAAVTLRLLVPIFSTFISNHELIYIMTAWMSWLINLTIAEGMIIVREKKKLRIIS